MIYAINYLKGGGDISSYIAKLRNELLGESFISRTL